MGSGRLHERGHGSRDRSPAAAPWLALAGWLDARQWGVEDLRSVDRRTLRFSAHQAEQMRQVVLSYEVAAQLGEKRPRP